MNKTVSVSLITAAAAASALAHDADTLAFYAFKEEAAETSLSGVTIENDAGEEFAGTVNIASGADDTMVYKADAPGAYVFDCNGYCATPLCSNPQSVYFAGGTTAANQRISFADLASAISSNDNYTVEFFVKLSPEDKTMATWAALLQLECGMLYNPKNPTSAEAALAGTPQATCVLFTGNQGQNLYTYVRSATYHPILNQATYNKCPYYTTGGTFFDGYWHHYAMVYKSSNHTLNHYLDYGLITGSYVTTNSTLDVSKPILLGNGGFRGWISCLRASKTARATSAFLRCSNEPTFVPETVFHWSLDGANGANAETVSNRCPAVNIPGIFDGQYIMLTSGGVRDGHGTVVSWTNGENVAVFPTFTNEIPFVRKPVVKYGEAEVGEDGGSVKLTAKTRTTEVYAVNGDGILLAGADHYPISGGSFTMEAWMKLDHSTWKTKMVDPNVSAVVKRLTIFGMYDKSHHYEWQLGLNYESDGFKLHLSAYDPSWTGSDIVVRPKVRYMMDNAWHHFAVVYDDPTRKFTAYVDGGAVTNVTLASGFVPHAAAPQYNVGYGLNNCAFEGLVDEVRLVRRALQPSEFLSFDSRKTGIMLLFW